MKILLLQSILPDYRLPVYLFLCDKLGKQFSLASNVDEAGKGFKLQPLPAPHFLKLRNSYLLGGKLQLQHGIRHAALRTDVLILELNPRILTTWPLVLLRKLRGKPTIVWGHAWPRSGENSRSDWLRHRLRSLADVVLVYTETQADDLRKKMPGKPILAAPNALYYRSEMERNLAQFGDFPRRTDFIYVGRLMPEKKPQLLMRAFIEAARDLDEEARLVFVGEGPERARLEAEAAQFDSKRILFMGHQSGADVLRPLYGRTIASVSPGYVGLSITQSFSYGVPMLIARDEPHAPEIEAAVEGKNSLIFESDSVTDLAKMLRQTYANRDKWAASGPAIIEDCMERYSIEKMAGRFIEAADLAYNK